MPNINQFQHQEPIYYTVGVLDSCTPHCEDQSMTLSIKQLKPFCFFFLQIIKALFEYGDVFFPTPPYPCPCIVNIRVGK